MIIVDYEFKSLGVVLGHPAQTSKQDDTFP